MQCTACNQVSVPKRELTLGAKNFKSTPSVTIRKSASVVRCLVLNLLQDHKTSLYDI